MQKAVFASLLLCMALLFSSCLVNEEGFHSLINITINNQSSYDVLCISRRIGENEEKEFKIHESIDSKTSKTFTRASGYMYEINCDAGGGVKWSTTVYIDFDQDFTWNLNMNVEFYPSENFRIWNFESNVEDQYGINDWDEIANIIYSPLKKFGNYSLSASSNQIAFMSTPKNYSIKNSNSCGIWIYAPINYNDAVSFIEMYECSSTFDFYFITCYLIKDSSGLQAFLTIIMDGITVTSIYSNYIDTLNWHFIAFSHDSATNTIYLICDNEVLSENIAGTWGADLTGAGLIVSAYNMDDGNVMTYVDEMIFIPDEFIVPSVFINHYNHNVPWGSEYIP